MKPWVTLEEQERFKAQVGKSVKATIIKCVIIVLEQSVCGVTLWEGSVLLRNWDAGQGYLKDGAKFSAILE